MPRRRGVKLSRRAEKALEIVEARFKEQLKSAIREVSGDPLLGNKLKSESEGLRSYRLGPFRIVYRCTTELLEVVLVDHRKDVYR